MRILIDTQIFLWLFGDSTRVPSKIREILTDSNTEVYFSAASAWEIAIKFGTGRLKLPVVPSIFVPDRLRRASFRWLDINHKHTLAVTDLPSIHKDPFDRLLVTQSIVEDMSLLSADGIFREYPVKLIDLSSRR